MPSVNDHGYAVGLGTLSLINAGLAQTKGRSRLAWWVVSLLIGPLATLLIVVLPMRHGIRVKPQKVSPSPLPDKL